MKKTLKPKKLSIGGCPVRVISTYDLRDIVGGTNGGGVGSDPKGPSDLKGPVLAGESS